MKIGLIGSGRIGGTVGTLWAKAGHTVFFSSRHPEQLADLVRQIGPNAQAGTIREAAQFGEVLLDVGGWDEAHFIESPRRPNAFYGEEWHLDTARQLLAQLTGH